MLTKERVSAEASALRTVRREAGSMKEFLVQHAFYKRVRVSGRCDVCVNFRDPLPLDRGKSAWHLYSAAIPLLREMGHIGPAVHHYGFDRQKCAARSIVASHGVRALHWMCKPRLPERLKVGNACPPRRPSAPDEATLHHYRVVAKRIRPFVQALAHFLVQQSGFR